MRGVGVGQEVSFRKAGCGIEGKWKDGKTGLDLDAGFARFPHEGAEGMWIYGCGEWKGWFWALVTRGWERRVLQEG